MVSTNQCVLSLPLCHPHSAPVAHKKCSPSRLPSGLVLQPCNKAAKCQKPQEVVRTTADAQIPGCTCLDPNLGVIGIKQSDGVRTEHFVFLLFRLLTFGQNPALIIEIPHDVLYRQ